MNIYITYSNERYRNVRDFSAIMALRVGKFEKAVVYSPEDIDKDFKKDNEHILSITKGNGLWLWKPYFVNKALEEAQMGDVIFYADAASFFIRSCRHIINAMNSDIWLCDLPYIEEEYTKAELFTRFDCDSDMYKKTNQFHASFMAFRKTPESSLFVKEWLRLCTDADSILDSFDEKIQSPYFVAHKMDQSILSLLAKKNKILSHYDASQFGKWHYQQDSCYTYRKLSHLKEYPICIILHRKYRLSIVHCICLYFGVISYPKWLKKLYFFVICKKK